MNFKDWTIKVGFHEIDYSSPIEEKQEQKLMEHTIGMLINSYDYMPRIGDLIGDIEGDAGLFEVEQVQILPNIKTVAFVLSLPEEDD